jgi:hypothetical protein
MLWLGMITAVESSNEAPPQKKLNCNPVEPVGSAEILQHQQHMDLTLEQHLSLHMDLRT